MVISCWTDQRCDDDGMAKLLIIFPGDGWCDGLLPISCNNAVLDGRPICGLPRTPCVRLIDPLQEEIRLRGSESGLRATWRLDGRWRWAYGEVPSYEYPGRPVQSFEHSVLLEGKDVIDLCLHTQTVHSSRRMEEG